MATRGSGVSKAEWDRACKAAYKAISLLQPGSRTSDVAATFTSPATGERAQHVVDISAVVVDSKCTMWTTRPLFRTTTAQMRTRQNRKPGHQRRGPLGHHHTSRHSRFRSCTLKMTIVDDVWTVIHLYMRGSMQRLREHQQVRDVMVNVSQNELRPCWVLTNSGRQIGKTGTISLCTSRKTSGELTGTWDTHQYNKWRNFIREAKVSDEATEGL